MARRARAKGGDGQGHPPKRRVRGGLGGHGGGGDELHPVVGDAPAGYAVIALATVLAYLPVFSAGFVWDDEIFTEAPQILNFGGIYDIWFRPRTMKEIHYWPVTYTSLWLDYRVWGLNPFGYHLTNVLFHVANACLVRRVLRKMGAAPDAALLAALVFAVHPLNVESVAWSIERKDVLSGFFYLCSLLLHPNVDAAAGGAPPGPSSPATDRLCLRISLASFVLAMLSKTIVVSLPAVLLLVPWALRGRIRSNELRNAELFFVVGMVLGAFDVYMARAGEPVRFGFSLVQRAMIAGRAVCFYASKLVWPGVQMVIYPRWNLREEGGTWLVCLVVPVAALLGLFVGRGRLGRGPAAALLFFAGTLFPVLGFIDYGYMKYSFVADRFQYLAGLGPISCLSAWAVHLSRRRGGKGRHNSEGANQKLVASTMIVVALLGSRTRQHAGVYHDQETFFSHILRVNPAAKSAHMNLGNLYLTQERWSEALPYLEKATEMDPREASAFVNLGIVLSELRKFNETIEVLERALTLRPKNKIKALNALGNAMSSEGRYADAVKYFREALELKPDYAIGWNNMGNDLARMEQFEEAIQAYETALRIRPTYTKAKIHLAYSLGKLRRHADAIALLNEVLDSDPGNKLAKEQLAFELDSYNRMKKK